jgi:EAL domain-containing protein (putative c-di-GMP-specific phosphodiesterase class I)
VSGDEFAVLVENVTNMREVTMLAERISNALQQSFTLDGHDIVVTASIGIVLGERGRGTSEELLRNSDIAMYRAKDAGRGSYVVFDPSMNATMLERLKLENDLRRAIARDELRVYYQPIVELATGIVVRMEALVRWMHPTLGTMAPGAFIPLAEEAGLIRMIDHWVLGAACRQLANWHARYPGNRIVLNVNLSAQGFQHPDLVQDVASALADAGVAATDVQLEITESVIMTDAPATHARLRELKSLGLRLAIDDFGTGYSSLSYLNRFPVDTLKIDKSFIDGLGSDADDTAIVQAIVSLAQALGLGVTAEGVETELATTLLQEIGCEMAQGYFYARPMPAELLEALWANGLRIDVPWLASIDC